MILKVIDDGRAARTWKARGITPVSQHQLDRHSGFVESFSDYPIWWAARHRSSGHDLGRKAKLSQGLHEERRHFARVPLSDMKHTALWYRDVPTSSTAFFAGDHVTIELEPKPALPNGKSRTQTYKLQLGENHLESLQGLWFQIFNSCRVEARRYFSNQPQLPLGYEIAPQDVMMRDMGGKDIGLLCNKQTRFDADVGRYRVILPAVGEKQFAGLVLQHKSY